MLKAEKFIYDPSLVLYLPLWKKDGDSIMDESAYGNLCSVTGATWGIQGRTFTANHNINCGDNVALDITSAITLIFWAKTTSFATAQHTFGRDDGTNRNYFMGPSSTGLTWVFVLMIGGVAKVIYAASNKDTGVFQHVVGTYDGATQNIYVDGVVDATPIAATGAIDNDDVSLTLGERATVLDRDFAGTIGAAWIYSRALSALEIQRHFLATSWRYR